MPVEHSQSRGNLKGDIEPPTRARGRFCFEHKREDGNDICTVAWED